MFFGVCYVLRFRAACGDALVLRLVIFETSVCCALSCWLAIIDLTHCLISENGQQEQCGELVRCRGVDDLVAHPAGSWLGPRQARVAN
jgi:hypothetical protein